MEKDSYHIRTTLEDIHRLMEELVALQRDNPQCCRAVALPLPEPPVSKPEPESPPREHYQESELMTIKEAIRYLRASRWKIDDMRRRGILQTLRDRRNVRLIRAQVEAARQWSVNKGRI